MKKKILSLFLAVMMVVSAFAAVAVSADTAECSYTVDGGAATSGKLSDAIAACTAGKVVVVTLNNCTLAEGATYTVAGDLTINGGTMQNVGLKQSTTSKITLNSGTINKLTLETELGAEGYYVSATLVQNGGTINTLVTNPDNLDLTGRVKYNK